MRAFTGECSLEAWRTNQATYAQETFSWLSVHVCALVCFNVVMLSVIVGQTLTDRQNLIVTQHTIYLEFISYTFYCRAQRASCHRRKRHPREIGRVCCVFSSRRAWHLGRFEGAAHTRLHERLSRARQRRPPAWTRRGRKHSQLFHKFGTWLSLSLPL